MLSEKNRKKIVKTGVYRHEPTVKMRGKLYANDLYHCFNWIFTVCGKDDNLYMVDTYYADKFFELTDENIDEFTFLFDRSKVREIPASEALDYADKDVICAPMDSGGWRCGKRYFVPKDAKKDKYKMIQRLKDDIETLVWKISLDEKEIKRIENGEYLVRYYVEDDIVDTVTVLADEEGGYVNALNRACNMAVEFDCDAFKASSDEDCDEEDEEDCCYEPSYYVEVYNPTTNIIMFWANTDGERGTDYFEHHPDDDAADDIKDVLEEFLWP